MTDVSFIPLIKAQNRPHTVLPYITPQPSNKDVERRRQRMGFVRVKPMPKPYAAKHPVPVIAPPPIQVPKITEEELKAARDWLDLSLNRKQSARRIKIETAERYGVPVALLNSQSRNKTLVKARHECFYRIRNELGWSLPKIATFMNRSDHTTVLSGIKRHELRLQMPEIDEVAPQRRDRELQKLVLYYTRRGNRELARMEEDNVSKSDD